MEGREKRWLKALNWGKLTKKQQKVAEKVHFLLSAFTVVDPISK